MDQISTMALAPLALLRLSVRVRLWLVGGPLVLILSFLWLLFPAPTWDFLLLLPLTLASWCFLWRGGFLCLGIMLLVVVSHYMSAFGSAFWSSIWGAFLLTRILAGSLICVLVAGLRQMTDALLKAQRAFHLEHLQNEVKDQILQNLSHELRTPLTQVQGYLELMADYHDHLDAPTRAQYLARASSGCEEMLDLITSALEAAQTGGNHRLLHHQLFSLSREIQTVLAHFDPRLLEHHPVTLAIPASLQVYAEPRFVRQIVRNLLANAFKYTPPSTPIVVRAVPSAVPQDERTTAIIVQVIDAGPGIPLKYQSSLFQRFARVPNPSAAPAPGVGLGLAICKHLVEAMGERIWVESSGREGEGCCFSFTLAREAQPSLIVKPEVKTTRMLFQF